MCRAHWTLGVVVKILILCCDLYRVEKCAEVSDFEVVKRRKYQRTWKDLMKLLMSMSLVFFQNPCPGISATELQKEEAFTEKGDGCATRPINIANEEGRGGGKIVGGLTCCVPDCFSNSKRNPEPSFYNLPNGKSKERQELPKKWLHMISREDFKDSGLGHRVCSKHFVGGQKTYMNNIPTIVPKTKKQERAEREGHKET